MPDIKNSLLPLTLIEGEQPYNLRDRMAHYNVPGVSVAVIKDFEIERVEHYGIRDADLGTPVSDNTVFFVGSLSKAVTAAIVLHLAYKGNLDLDDNINDYAAEEQNILQE